jgi:hypothetical protein
VWTKAKRPGSVTRDEWISVSIGMKMSTIGIDLMFKLATIKYIETLISEHDYSNINEWSSWYTPNERSLLVPFRVGHEPLQAIAVVLSNYAFAVAIPKTSYLRAGTVPS